MSGPDLEKRQLLAEIQARMFGKDDPVQVGRYVVERLIGSGGMGSVYAARDPELDRTVALKLLHGRYADAGRQARLLREARALARLTHPNIVEVYDVGTASGRVFIAMELIEGVALDAWLRDRPREWREIIVAFVDAGRGVVAAHAAGVVHRDFKPSNVLCGADARMRVVDFGLARHVLHDAEIASVGSRAAPGGDSSGSSTQLGAVVGTPRYMSPEQFRGEPAGLASDQFAFCVSLFEALYDVYPFAGDLDPFVAKEEGKVVQRPADTRVPRRVHHAVLRGLAPRPDDRFGSMEALLAALQPRRSNRWLIGAAGLGAGAVALGLAMQEDPAARCAGAEARLDGVWDAQVRQSLRAVFAGAGPEQLSGTWPRLEQTLSRYATDWAAMYRRSCEATRVAGTQSEAVLDRRNRCLLRRRAELRAFVSGLGVAPRERLRDAVGAARALRPVAACGDAQALAATYDPPAGDIDPGDLQALVADLERVRGLLLSPDHEAAATAARSAADDAERLGYSPLLAEALLLVGRAVTRASRDREAANVLGRALQVAQEARHEEVEALARAQLMYVLTRLGESKAAEAEQGPALAAARRLGDETVLVHTLRIIGQSLAEDGRLEDAEARHREAVELSVSDSLLRADAEVALASVLARVGKVQEGLAAVERALAVYQRELGPGHRRSVNALGTLGGYYRLIGDDAKAREHYEQQIAILRSYLPPDHPNLAEALANFGAVLMSHEDYERALVHAREALAIYEAAYGQAHERVAWSGSLVGNVLIAQGAMVEGTAVLEGAYQLARGIFGDADPRLADYSMLVGVAYAETGRAAEAVQMYEHCERARRTALGADHPQVGIVSQALAEAFLSLGRRSDAARLGARALEIGRKHGMRDLEAAAADLLDRAKKPGAAGNRNPGPPL